MNGITDDAELKRIRENAEPLTPRDETEIAIGLSGKILIAGHAFPAPSAAVLAMLELIKSPFVGEEDINLSDLLDLDIFRALYVIGKRRGALMPILRMKHQEEAFARMETPNDAAGVYVIAEQQKKLAELRAEFDAEVLQYAETLGCFHIADAATEIGAYLALAGGFEMLPDPEPGDSKKKDITTSITSQV